MPVSAFDREHLDDQRALIALSMVPGVGASKIRNLVSELGTAQAVLDASSDELVKVKGISQNAAQTILSFDDFSSVDEQLKWAERAEATLLPFWDERFSYLLDQIYDPPAFLWVRGDLSVFNQPAIAIVGTRNPTSYGKRAARYFAEALAEAGLAVVSGLAFGIDAVAHQAAIDAQGNSIAVLGSGIDRIYPSKHTKLARDLVMQGAVVSELPLRSKPDARNFPKRNRIISGMSLGTLVVEAFKKGGALITARLALEQNREVFAVPGSIFNVASIGCNALVQVGHARLVYRPEDILEELSIQKKEDLAQNGQTDNPQEIHPERTKPAVDLTALGSIEQALYSTLTDEPMHIDEICRKAGLDVSTALVYLLSLEFKGLIYQMAGKHFYKS